MSTTEPTFTTLAKSVGMNFHYDVTGAPTVMGPWAKYGTVPEHAEVTLTLDDDGSSVHIFSVKITGYRAKKDGTAGLSPSTADFWLGLHGDKMPGWVLAIGEKAEMTVREWVKA